MSRPTLAVCLKRQPFEVYIGRREWCPPGWAGPGSDGAFGNPVQIGVTCPICRKTHYGKGSTIECYKQWFYNRLNQDSDFRRRVRELEGKVLGCFCEPWDQCHGDVIAEWLNSHTSMAGPGDVGRPVGGLTGMLARLIGEEDDAEAADAAPLPPTLGVTGHRPQHLTPRAIPGVHGFLRGAVCEMKRLHPDVRGMSGMALGVDTWFVEACIAEGVPYIAAVPFEGQERRWPMEAQRYYHQLLRGAAEVRVLGDPPDSARDASELLLGRNVWMSEQLTHALAVWIQSKTSGGTAHGVKSFKLKRLPLWTYDPATGESRRDGVW